MIDPDLIARVQDFRTTLDALRPLSSSPALKVAALVRLGQALVSDLDEAVASSGESLNDDIVYKNPSEIAALVNGRVQAAVDHSQLHDMRGFVGRAVFNLTQGGLA